MDFQSLSRKELQALCKKNKIPANMTNIAMADALKALEKVEGLDEFTTAGPHQSPEKTMAESPAIPRTQCRTSTRRKTINVEPETARPLTCTRRSTRRTTVTGEAAPEHKNVNLLETPAKLTTRRMPLAAETKLMKSCEDKKVVGQDKNDMPETPAMQLQSSRKKAPAAATARHRMVSQEEKSVLTVSGTRRSVRLLEKSMAELSMKDKGKIDELNKEIEDIEEKRDEPGADLQTVSEKSSEKTNDSEVLSAQNVDQVVENEHEMNNEHQEEVNKNDGPGVEDLNPKLEMGSEKGNALLDLSGLDSEDVDNNGSLNEAEFLQVENSEKAEDNMNHESSNGNGPDVLITENSNTLCAAFTSEIKEDLISERSCINIEAEEVPIVTHHVLATQHQINCMKEQSSDINQDAQSKNAIDTESDPNQSNEVQENDNADMVQKMDQLFLEDVCSEKLERKDESESPHSILRHNEVSDNLVTKSYNTIELPDPCEEDISAEYNLEALVDVDVVEADEFDMAYIGNTSWDSKRAPSPVRPLASESQVGLEIPLSEMTKASNSNLLVDVPVNIEAEEVSIVTHCVLATPHQINRLKQKSSEINQDPQSKNVIDIESAASQSAEVQENDNADMVQKTDQLFLEDVCSENLERNDECESPHSILWKNEVSDNLVTKSYNTIELPDHCEDDLSAEYNLEALVDVDVVEADEFDMAHIGNPSWDSERAPSPVRPLAPESQVGLEIPLSEMTKASNSDMLVDLPVMPAEEFSMVSYESPPTLAKTPTSIKQKSPCQPQVAAGEVTSEIVMSSPFAADTPQGQFPRPKGFTPRRPTIDASDINKENMDNSSRKVEFKNHNVKEVNDEAISYDASLRMLRKMLKEKLQISNKNNEAENVMKVEKKRLALQTVPENRMQAAEPETGN